MNQRTHKLTGLAAINLAAICLIAIAMSLTGHLDRRVTHGTDLKEQPLQTDGQPQELIRAVESDLSEQFQDRMVQLRGHMADFKSEPMRSQRLQEYFEIRDALELQNRMIEEFNAETNGQQQFEVQIYIPPQNATE